MKKSPEQEARETIDKMLDLSGWDVQDVEKADIRAKKGVAIREFPLNVWRLVRAYSAGGHVYAT